MLRRLLLCWPRLAHSFASNVSRSYFIHSHRYSSLSESPSTSLFPKYYLFASPTSIDFTMHAFFTQVNHSNQGLSLFFPLSKSELSTFLVNCSFVIRYTFPSPFKTFCSALSPTTSFSPSLRFTSSFLSPSHLVTHSYYVCTTFP